MSGQAARRVAFINGKRRIKDQPDNLTVRRQNPWDSLHPDLNQGQQILPHTDSAIFPIKLRHERPLLAVSTSFRDFPERLLCAQAV